jgi:hypothetical protein
MYANAGRSSLTPGMPDATRSTQAPHAAVGKPSRERAPVISRNAFNLTNTNPAIREDNNLTSRRQSRAMAR